MPITTDVVSSNLDQDDRSMVSSTNKTDRDDISEILLKVALNTIKQTNKQKSWEDKFAGGAIIFMST